MYGNEIYRISEIYTMYPATLCSFWENLSGHRNLSKILYSHAICGSAIVPAGMSDDNVGVKSSEIPAVTSSKEQAVGITLQCIGIISDSAVTDFKIKANLVQVAVIRSEY